LEPIDNLDFEAERDAIIKELRECKLEVLVRFSQATLDELDRGLKDGFNVLHISGHGSTDYIVFEDGKGGSQPIYGEYLSKLIGTGGPFELALISTCFSEPTGNLVNNAGVPHVVAIRRDSTILDKAAIVFAGTFYRHLFNKETIQHSFDMAKLLVEGNPEIVRAKTYLEKKAFVENQPFVAEEEKFLLIPQSKTHHKVSLYQEVGSGALTIEEPKYPKTNITTRSQSFRGRSREIYECINKIIENRLVTITGSGGIGKTTLAFEVARWFKLRGDFADGIFVADLRGANTAGRMLDIIGTCLERQFADYYELIEHLRNKSILLVLDNMEEVLIKDEEETRKLLNITLKQSEKVKILATSQRPIGGVLHEPETLLRLGVLYEEDANELFLANSKRKLTLEEWSSQAREDLLGILGGHPLSIILIARQLSEGVTFEDLVFRLNNYKAKAITIKGISERDPQHGESLVASLLLSFNSLSDKSKELFKILSMVPAGVDRQLLEMIISSEIWNSAQELYELSLAEINQNRLTLLPPIRLFSEDITEEAIRYSFGPKIANIIYLLWKNRIFVQLSISQMAARHQIWATSLRHCLELTTC
jgi:hypothetical protein